MATETEQKAKPQIRRCPICKTIERIVDGKPVLFNKNQYDKSALMREYDFTDGIGLSVECVENYYKSQEGGYIMIKAAKKVCDYLSCETGERNPA